VHDRRTRWISRAVFAYIKLYRLAPELNAVRDSLRRIAEQIAGCNLDEWTFGDVVAYIDLFIAVHKEAS
jgi:hypothetical protein